MFGTQIVAKHSSVALPTLFFIPTKEPTRLVGNACFKSVDQVYPLRAEDRRLYVPPQFTQIPSTVIDNSSQTKMVPAWH